VANLTTDLAGKLSTSGGTVTGTVNIDTLNVTGGNFIASGIRSQTPPATFPGVYLGQDAVGSNVGIEIATLNVSGLSYIDFTRCGTNNNSRLSCNSTSGLMTMSAVGGFSFINPVSCTQALAVTGATTCTGNLTVSNSLPTGGNVTTNVTNTGASGFASLYLNAPSETGQLFVGQGGGLTLRTNTAHDVVFKTNDVERLRLRNSDGSVIIAGSASLGSTLTWGGDTYNAPTSTTGGSTYPTLLSIKADGVTEVGKCLDFHTASAQTSEDFPIRLTANAGALDCTGAVTRLQHAGTAFRTGAFSVGSTPVMLLWNGNTDVTGSVELVPLENVLRPNFAGYYQITVC